MINRIQEENKIIREATKELVRIAIIRLLEAIIIALGILFTVLFITYVLTGNDEICGVTATIGVIGTICFIAGLYID